MKPTARILFITVLVLTGAVFLYSAYTKLYPVELLEYTLVGMGIANWTVAEYLARILIGVEFFLAIALLTNWNFKKFTFRATFLLLAIFSIYLIYLLITKGNKGDCGCFGTALQMNPFEGLLKNIGLMVLLIVVRPFWSGWRMRYDNIAATLVCITALTLPFILNPPNSIVPPPASLTAHYTFPMQLLYNDSKNAAPTVNLHEKKWLVAFFSLTCPHCRIAAKKLAILHKMHPTWNFYMVLNGKDEDVQSFFDDTQTEGITHQMFTGPSGFLQMTGGQWPAIYWMNNGVVERKSTYQNLDETQLTTWFAHAE